MTFDKRPIKVAVATQVMVDEDACPAYAAVNLIRKFFAGEQDLSYSDGANDAAQNLWKAAGGNVALLNTLAWIRVLRPTQYAITLLKRRERWTSVARALWPVCQAIDAAFARTETGRHWLPEVTDTTVEDGPAEEILLRCIRQFGGNRALQPEYEPDRFRWLLKKASEKRMHGELRKSVVRNAIGEIVGWYLYYVKRGGIGQVLQFGGNPKCIRKVLNQLFYQAWEQGAVAVSGRLEPQFATELVQSRCGFIWPGYAVLVQSRNREILNAIYQGDTFLSRLEGEWWARFSDPEWSLEGMPLDAAVRRAGGVREAVRVHAGRC